MANKVVAYTFLFNLFVVFLFSFIYCSIPQNNFIPLNRNDNMKYIDFLFYSVTIQSGIGLPDITASTDLAKSLALIQQFLLMGSAFILFSFIIDT
jgi:hypothetical protein